jgi:hypothetical protein
MISLLYFLSSLWTASQENGSPFANGGASMDLGLHHLHTQETGGRTDTWMARSASLGRPTQAHPARFGRPFAPVDSLDILHFAPPIASIWRHHPHVQYRGSSHMKFGLLRFNPLGCSFVRLQSSPPLGVISSCTWTREKDPSATHHANLTYAGADIELALYRIFLTLEKVSLLTFITRIFHTIFRIELLQHWHQT